MLYVALHADAPNPPSESNNVFTQSTNKRSDQGQGHLGPPNIEFLDGLEDLEIESEDLLDPDQITGSGSDLGPVNMTQTNTGTALAA